MPRLPAMKLNTMIQPASRGRQTLRAQFRAAAQDGFSGPSPYHVQFLSIETICSKVLLQ